MITIIDRNSNEWDVTFHSDGNKRIVTAAVAICGTSVITGITVRNPNDVNNTNTGLRKAFCRVLDKVIGTLEYESKMSAETLLEIKNTRRLAWEVFNNCFGYPN